MRNTWNLKVEKRVKPKPEAGFTLLEIMVAVSIVAIVLVSVYKMHAQTIWMSNAVKFHTTAPLLAQQKLAEFEATSSHQQISDSGDFGDGFPGYAWQLSVDDIDSEFLGNVAEDLKRVDVTVTFRQNENSYHIRAYRFDR
jgi:general secretion pathway protein I